MNETQKLAEIYKRMKLEEAKKKMDPVGQADGDIDNDGDEDESDEYLHNRRKAIKKSMKKDDKKMDEKTECPKCKGEGCDHCDNKGYHEALEIDPDDGETKKVSGKEDEKKKKKKASDTETSDGEQQVQEVAEPSTELGKKFKGMHKAEVDDTEEKGHQDAVSAGRAGPSRKLRPGDNAQGDTKGKKLKELRK